MNVERCFAPAKIHSLASSLIFWSTAKFVDSVRSKTLAFLSFQISQQTSIMSERRPFLLVPGAFDIAVHHFSSVSLGGHALGCKLEFWVQVVISFQRRFVNLQSRKRWRPVSTWSRHSVQVPWFSHLRASNLSAVQTQFWIASQPKNLNLQDEPKHCLQLRKSRNMVRLNLQDQ
jgi:hypothetical protein